MAACAPSFKGESAIRYDGGFGLRSHAVLEGLGGVDHGSRTCVKMPATCIEQQHCARMF